MRASAVISSAVTTSTNRVERITVTTQLSYLQLIQAFEEELGHWETQIGNKLVAERSDWAVVKKDVELMTGLHGLMILERVDQGRIASLSGQPVDCILYLVGNPEIATEILRTDVRAGMLVPFRVQLFDDGKNGVISYDRPGSSLDTLGNPALNRVGMDLDQKMAAVVTAILARTTGAR